VISIFIVRQELEIEEEKKRLEEIIDFTSNRRKGRIEKLGQKKSRASASVNDAIKSAERYKTMVKLYFLMSKP
jgi:hypothetical protein